MKHIQLYITTFELEYRNVEQLSHRQQPPTTSQSTIVEVFETLETAYVDISTAHSMIEPIENIHLNTRMDQINVNTFTKTVGSSTNTDPIKDQRHLKLYT